MGTTVCAILHSLALTLLFSLRVHRTGEMGRRGAPSFGLTLETPGLDHFSAYSHCIVGVVLAIICTLAMYAFELVNANGLSVQVMGCRRTKLKLNVGASLEPFGSFIAVFTVTTRSFTALLYVLTLSISLL